MARLVSKLATKTSLIARNANLPSDFTRDKIRYLMWFGIIIFLLCDTRMWMVLSVKFIGGIQLSRYAFGVVEYCCVSMPTECVFYQFEWRLHDQLFYRPL